MSAAQDRPERVNLPGGMYFHQWGEGRLWALVGQDGHYLGPTTWEEKEVRTFAAALRTALEGMLDAFAEGVSWTDEQRAAYEIAHFVNRRLKAAREPLLSAEDLKLCEVPPDPYDERQGPYYDMAKLRATQTAAMSTPDPVRRAEFERKLDAYLSAVRAESFAGAWDSPLKVKASTDAREALIALAALSTTADQSDAADPTDASLLNKAACQYAEGLAIALAKRVGAVPEWRPLSGDLIGLLTQIDNCTMGLLDPRLAAAPIPDEVARLREALLQARSRLLGAGMLGGEDDLINQALISSLTQPKAEGWQPIKTVPVGEHVLLYFPKGERGNGGMETAMVFPDEQEPANRLMSGWSHGGPNSGLDFEFSEPPTHWRLLPTPPSDQ